MKENPLTDYISLRYVDLDELFAEIKRSSDPEKRLEILSRHLPCIRQAKDLGLSNADLCGILAMSLLRTRKVYLEEASRNPRSIVP